MPPPNAPGGGIHPHHKTTFLHFYWGKNAEFLFSGWPGNSSGMYALALIFVFLLAFFVELLSHFDLIKPSANRVASAFLQTGIYAVRAGLAYMVMLAVMSYNGGVFLAAVAGHAVGFFVFKCLVFSKGSGFG
ncbi:hypothetical protein LguiB_035334 [Lonicera macranthoides]